MTESNYGIEDNSMYGSGNYDVFQSAADGVFKADEFIRLFSNYDESLLRPDSYADVGCGSGEVAKRISDSLRARGHELSRVSGYDVSPHVKDLQHENVEFRHANFVESGDYYDLVTLFDVFEHVPDPINFVRAVSEKCSLLACHIPLDSALWVKMRGLNRNKLANPGHLICLDVAAAQNMLAYSGLRLFDFSYTLGFNAPSGRRSVGQKLMYPLRSGLSMISPWLLSVTLGGTSLMTLALTPKGLERYGDAFVHSGRNN